MFESLEMQKGFLLAALLARDSNATLARSALAADAQNRLTVLDINTTSSREESVRELATHVKPTIDPERIDDARVYAWLGGELPRELARKWPDPMRMRRGFVAHEGLRNTLRALVAKRG